MKSIVLAAAALAGCAATPLLTAQDRFFAAISRHCGHALHGRVVTTDPRDAALIGKAVVGRFVACTANEVRINVAVGEDRSRNWVISRTPDGLRLKHLHLHNDGTEDQLSRYGGDANAPGSAVRQEFPLDAFSKELFTRTNRPGSLTNIWAIEARSDGSFAYELRNATGRFFRMELRRRHGA